MEQKNKELPEEKYSTNFIVEFPEEFKLPSWTIMEVNKPKYSNSEWQPIYTNPCVFDIFVIFLTILSK